MSQCGLPILTSIHQRKGHRAVNYSQTNFHLADKPQLSTFRYPWRFNAAHEALKWKRNYEDNFIAPITSWPSKWISTRFKTSLDM